MRSLAVFTPFDLVPGGGERYVLSIAAAAADRFDVSLVTPRPAAPDAIRQLGSELGVAVDGVRPLSLDEAAARGPFDVWVALGNEALPAVPALGRRNIYMCQFPYPMAEADAAARRPYCGGYRDVVINSAYVRPHLARQLASLAVRRPRIHVISPPSDRVAAGGEPARDARAIVSVGRFFDGGHCKRQDELILAFGRLLERTEATLHLAGTVVHRSFFDRCRALAEGLPVFFHPDASREEVGRLYEMAGCYWHGAGLNADREREPGNFEHFGITVVEAMAAGCIPFVLDHGGPAATVRHGIDGWRYRSPADLVDKTHRFLRALPARRAAMQVAARWRARAFHSAAFGRKWRRLIEA